jgi:hypothetical protein
LLSVLIYEAEGAINFKYLTLAGNLCLVSLPAAFLIGRRLPCYFYISVLPLFFAATPYASSYWATNALSNLPVVLLAVLAAHVAFC